MTNILDILKFVFNNMFEKKSRVFLTISGIIIGIFTFTFFIFASQGLSNAITEQFSTFGLNVLAVQKAGTSAGPPSGEGLTDTDIAKIKQVISDYKYVAPGIASSIQYEYGREKAIIVSISYPDEIWEEASDDIGIEIEEGRFLRNGDKGVIFLGYKAAKTAFGDDNPVNVGSSIKVGDKSLRVIGIGKERGDLFLDSSVQITFDDAKEILNQDTYSLIRISFYDNADLDVMQANIERKLNPRGKEKQITITSPKQAIEQFDMILGGLQMIIGFVSFIALIVGGINVMNTMYSNILERTNEISVMKALGATNADIRNMFLIESGTLGLTGVIIGFLLSFGLAKTLSYLITNYAGYNVPVYFEINFFLIIVITTTIIAMLFGTYPAIKAAQINPADNLKDE
ncbi:MAG: ABC transporter permease [Nanoarchaeota archaeon]|nr:ABC transporter permease [Nanoarchaeota archaeon]